MTSNNPTVLRAPPTRFVSMERRLGDTLPRTIGESVTVSTQGGVRRIERRLEGYKRPKSPTSADSTMIMKTSEHLLRSSPKPQNKLNISPVTRRIPTMEDLMHRSAIHHSPQATHATLISDTLSSESITPTESHMSHLSPRPEAASNYSHIPPTLITQSMKVATPHVRVIKHVLEAAPLHAQSKDADVRVPSEDSDAEPPESPELVTNHHYDEVPSELKSTPTAESSEQLIHSTSSDNQPSMHEESQSSLHSTVSLSNPSTTTTSILSPSTSSITIAPIRTTIVAKKVPSLKYLQLQEQIRQFLLCEYNWHVPLFEPISHLEQLAERLLSLLSISIRNRISQGGTFTLITEIDAEDYSSPWLAINALMKEADLNFNFSSTDVEKNLHILKDLLKELYKKRIVKANIAKIRVEHLLFKHPDQGFSYVPGKKNDLDSDQSIISNPLNFVKQRETTVYTVLRDASGAIIQFDDEFLRSTESMSHNFSSRDTTGIPVRFFCRDLDTTREVEIADVEYLASCEFKFKIPVPDKKHTKIMIMAENCLVQRNARNKLISYERHLLGIMNVWRFDLISQDEFYNQRILTDHAYLLEKLASQKTATQRSVDARHEASQRDAALNSEMAAAGVPRVVIAGEEVAFKFKLPHLLANSASLRLMDSSNHSNTVDLPLKVEDRVASVKHRFRRTGVYACMFVQGEQGAVIDNQSQRSSNAKVLRTIRVVPAAAAHFDIIPLQKRPQCGLPNTFCLKVKDSFGNEIRKNFFLLVKSSLPGISLSLRTNKEGLFSFSMNQADKFLVQVFDGDTSPRATPADEPLTHCVPLNISHPLHVRVHPAKVDFRKTELLGIDGLGNDEVFAGRKKRFSVIFKDSYHNTVNPKRIKVSCQIHHRDVKDYTVSNIQATRRIDRMDFEFCVAHAGVYYINLRFQQADNSIEENMRFQIYAKPSVIMEHPFSFRSNLKETDLVSMVMSFKHALSRDSILAHEYISQYQETKKQLMDALHKHRGFSRQRSDMLLLKEHIEYVRRHSQQRRSVLDFLNHHSSEHKNERIQGSILVPTSPQGKGSDEFMTSALAGDKSVKQLAALKMLEYRTKGWVLNNKVKRIQCELPIKQVPVLENPIQAASVIMKSQDMHISVAHFLKYSLECFKTFKSERSHLATLSLYLQLLLNRSRTGSVNHETLTTMLKEIEAESSDERLDPNHPWLPSMCKWVEDSMKLVDTSPLESHVLVHDLLTTDSSLSEALISRILLCPFMIDLALIHLSFVFDSIPDREIHCESIDHILELCADEHLRAVCEKTMEEVFKHTWVPESDVLLLLLILYHDSFERRLKKNLIRMKALSNQLNASLPGLHKLEGETLVIKEEMKDKFLSKKVKNYKLKTLMARGVISSLNVPEPNEELWLKSQVHVTCKGDGVFNFDILHKKNILQESEVSIVECILHRNDVIRKQALILDANATLRILDKFVA